METPPERERRNFERRAAATPDDLAAAIAAAHTIIERTGEDSTRELARTIVVVLQRLQKETHV